MPDEEQPSAAFKRYLDEVEKTLPVRHRRVATPSKREAWWVGPLMLTVTALVIIAFVTWRMVRMGS